MEEKLKEQLINKQFEMIGEKITYQDIKNGLEVKDGKKMVAWYNHYHFKTVEQYDEWIEWCRGQVEGMEDADWQLKLLDWEFGMTYSYHKEPKEGEQLKII